MGGSDGRRSYGLGATYPDEAIRNMEPGRCARGVWEQPTWTKKKSETEKVTRQRGWVVVSLWSVRSSV